MIIQKHINISSEKTVGLAVKEALANPKRERGELIDRALVEAMCQGDDEAFQKIYLHSYDKLKKFLEIILHNTEDAEEVVQNIFLYILENREKINPSMNFKGYLYKVAKTNAFKMLSHKKLDQKYSDYKQNMSASDYFESPDEVIITNELALMITIYVDKMPTQRKRVFELSRGEGKSISEISEIMELSPQTVKNYLQAATKGLRELIALFIILFLS